ncbi:MAG TPA: tetratricopeptide repeat protein [Candidatus Binatus sp.]|nr:tetratricopeptide repeat protein [Candidatus Binatus sp.]
MTRTQNVIAVAMLAVVGAVGLGGCFELVAVGGAAYAPFHKPEALAKPYAMLRRHECSVADSEFSDFLVTTPNDARAISGKADALVCLEKYDDAIASYSHAIELDPKWFDYLGRGIAYRAKGDATQALQNIDAGIAIAPTVPTLYVYRGVVLNARGDAAGARADFEKVSALISNSRGSFNRYGWALATSPISAYRDGPTAILYATHACDLTSWKDAYALDTLAAAYAENGQFDEAVKWQTSALALLGNVERDEFEARLAMYRKREPYRSQSDAPMYF